MTIKFFKSPSHFREWLEANHASVQELWVGYYKKSSAKTSITWPESVDQALCFGWIDGLRKSIDELSYKIRFTPRKPTSVWSTVNVNRVEVLTNEGLMHPAGLAAFEKRKDNRSGIYSYEQRTDAIPEPYAKKLQANKAAWDFVQAQIPSYRKAVGWWVVSAKKEETRQKRLDKLIEDSANGRTIDQYTRLQKSKGGS
jgi:uncharacterized protein YdeI (YjbR/CyaY-like superfamily)